MDKGFIKIIANKYGIKYQTLKNKYNKNKNDDTVNHENRMLCNKIIKLHAIDKCKKLYPDKKFNASNEWYNIFKQKWKLSIVKCSISRIATTIYTNDEINIFLKKCKDFLL